MAIAVSSTPPFYRMTPSGANARPVRSIDDDAA
jgi:hypothetical protein